MKCTLLRTARFSLLPLLLLLSGCTGPVLDPAGDIAREQRDLILMSTALMLIIIVPVIVLIILFAWRYRKGGGGTYDPKFDHSTVLELAIWSAPLMIIIALGALTWSSTHLLDPFRPLTADRPSPEQLASGAKQEASPLVVRVVSLDWKWLFIYPEQNVATVNELVLPVNRQVRFDITSSNMMNTFYAPTLAGMIYAMPGMQSQLHAILRRTGTFEGYSGNYSGAGFSDMRFQLKSVDQAGFAQWVADTRKSQRKLALSDYKKLAEPSERVPIIRFSSADPDLYRRILERCVEPGTTCTGTMMMHGSHDRSTPAAHGHTLPEKPKGAIFKEGHEKGSGSHVTKPAPPEEAPGMKKPGHPKNRNQS